MTKPEFAKLERLNPRDYWPNEAADFTPWLAEEESIRLLGDAMGMELEVESTEVAVGPFSADIVCRSSPGDHRVVIENQLEKTDHDHLGKLLTYAAGLDDVRTVVWIAPSFTDEHRAALDWLNGVTEQSANFFGVELEVWQIGDSRPAPRFNMVAKPNEWTKTVRESADRGSLTEWQQLQLDYWIAFRAYLEAQGSPIRTQKPQAQSWTNVAIGRSGTHLSAVITTWDDDVGSYTAGVYRVELVLDGSDAKGFFTQLEATKSEIEEELGTSLTWHNPEQTRQCRLSSKRPVDLERREDWTGQFAWLQEQLERFHKVLEPRVKALT